MGGRRRDTSERRLSEEEATLFARAMADVDRTPPAPPQPSPPPASGGVRAPSGVAPPEEEGRAENAFAVERKPVAPRPVLLDRRGAASGVDRRTAQRLARGQMPIEGRIDLHGMTQAKARRALERFLAAAEGAGRRCVLVITGKGAARDDGEGAMPDRDAGVLRRSLPRWLALPGLRERVVAYCPAIPRHGGAGAFYILLRRRR